MRGKKIIIPKDLKESILKLYSTGNYSSRDIMKITGVEYRIVQRIAKENNVIVDKNSLMSLKQKGKVSPRKGVKLSEETKNKISLNSKRHKSTLGFKFSDESKLKMSIARKKAIERNPELLNNLKRGATKLSNEERELKIKYRSVYKQLLSRIVRKSNRNYTKLNKSKIELGYSEKEYISHITSQFTDNMSWENRKSFEIDHIIPIDFYLKNKIYDPKIINALSNLRPITMQENRSKGNKI